MDDMTRANCPVCVTVASERCSFCLRSKLSTTSRMHLEELGKRLLDRDPNLSAAALLEVLRNYGRSSRFAAETNASLRRWDPNCMYSFSFRYVYFVVFMRLGLWLILCCYYTCKLLKWLHICLFMLTIIHTILF